MATGFEAVAFGVPHVDHTEVIHGAPPTSNGVGWVLGERRMQDLTVTLGQLDKIASEEPQP